MQQQVLLADEYPLSHIGLKSLLQSHIPPTEVRQVSSIEALLQELAENQYSHLVLDTVLAGGNTLDVLPLIVQNWPSLRIMLFYRDTLSIKDSVMKQYGIHYSLSKTSSEEETKQALHRFLRNEAPARPPSEGKKIADNPFSTLAPRELQIMHHVVRGARSKEIAEALNVKINTISTVKKRIFEKTSTSNESELMKLSALYNIDF